MNADGARSTDAWMQSIQPIVLVGGKSRRFGRDKLREPCGDALLVERPIAALRAIFGARVKLVGACDARILPLADGAIDDAFPGVGPIGGIISALRTSEGAVFVLAGDMPNIEPTDVQCLIETARSSMDAWVVLALTDHVHPCCGIYFRAALPSLEAALAAGHRALHSACPTERVRTVVLRRDAVRNVNAPCDLHPSV